MIRSLKAVAALGAFLATAPALASDLLIEASPVADTASGIYATFFAGGTLPSGTTTLVPDDSPVGLTIEADLDSGMIFGGAVGTTVLPHLRGEVEFSVSLTKSRELEDEGDANIVGYNVLGNLWYDIDTGSSFSPYIGGGVGYGYDVVTSEESPGEMNIAGIVYQLGAGVRVAATDDVTLDLGYRYRVRPDAEVTWDGEEMDGGSVKSSGTTHILQAGVTFGF